MVDLAEQALWVSSWSGRGRLARADTNGWSVNGVTRDCVPSDRRAISGARGELITGRAADLTRNGKSITFGMLARGTTTDRLAATARCFLFPRPRRFFLNAFLSRRCFFSNEIAAPASSSGGGFFVGRSYMPDKSDAVTELKSRHAGAFNELSVVGALPMGAMMPSGGEAVFAMLTGALVVRAGSPPNGDIEGGGLIIDFVPAGSDQPLRVVFAFSELGMWVEWEGELPTRA